MKLLDGRVVQAEIKKRLLDACSALELKPHLVIIQVGERAESTLYIERKKEFANSIGVTVTHAHYPETISQADLISAIQNFNQDKLVHGIIVQIPLPDHLFTRTILNIINVEKDVDGLSASSLQSAWHNKPGLRPATACGVLALLNYYNIPLAGRGVAVVGRSALVGKPIALACLNAGATVTVCHRQTSNLSAVTKQADILISAAGSPNLITVDHVHRGQMVIDVGISATARRDGNVVSSEKLAEEVGSRKLVGDVDFTAVAPTVAAISPVPGGVGPLTIACLFENLLSAYTQQNSQR